MRKMFLCFELMSTVMVKAIVLLSSLRTTQVFYAVLYRYSRFISIFYFRIFLNYLFYNQIHM